MRSVNQNQQSHMPPINSSILTLPNIETTFPTVSAKPTKLKPKTQSKKEKNKIRKRAQRARESARQRHKRLSKQADYQKRYRAKQKKLPLQQQINLKQKANASVQRSRQKTKEQIFRLADGIESYDDDKIDLAYLGKCDQICPHCSAKLWKPEVYRAEKNIPSYSMCCSNGKYKIDDIPDIPQELKKFYLDNDTPIGKYFHENNALV